MAKAQAKQYDATATLSKFHQSDKPIRMIRGPVGSGKSVAMVMEIMRRAQETPWGPDGIRRSRAVAVRNTLQQLKTTNLITVQEWIRPIMTFKVSDATIQIRFTPKDGHPVECDLLLLPLDTPENVQRLLSLELTFAWVSEFRELPLPIVQAVFSRCGRYPSRSNVDSYWYGLFGETNSFSSDSDWYEFLELEKPGNVDYFVQPGAFDPGAENRQHLPPRYYEDLMEANSKSWVDQYIHNKIGPSLSGQAVYAKSFDSEFHTVTELIPNTGRPIVIGLDVGRNPAAVCGQIDARGRMCVYSSIYAENVGIELFLAEHLRPHLIERFPGTAQFWIAVDPAARARSQIGEESVQEAIKRMGFSVVLASTNNIAPRLRSVERYLGMQVAGGAGLLIDHGWNLMLIRGFQHDYRYTRDRKGTLGEVPEKKHPASDIADAMQYLCLSAGSNVLARAIHGPVIQKPAPSAAGWT